MRKKFNSHGGWTDPTPVKPLISLIEIGFAPCPDFPKIVSKFETDHYGLWRGRGKTAAPHTSPWALNRPDTNIW